MTSLTTLKIWHGSLVNTNNDVIEFGYLGIHTEDDI
jgi:hypothetical protein